MKEPDDKATTPPPPLRPSDFPGQLPPPGRTDLWKWSIEERRQEREAQRKAIAEHEERQAADRARALKARIVLAKTLGKWAALVVIAALALAGLWFGAFSKVHVGADGVDVSGHNQPEAP